MLLWQLFKQTHKISQYEPPHDKTNKMVCEPSEDSDQPGHYPNLIRIFAVRMKKTRVLTYQFVAQRRLLIRLGGCPGWSVFVGAKAFCWFCHEVAHICTEYQVWELRSHSPIWSYLCKASSVYSVWLLSFARLYAVCTYQSLGLSFKCKMNAIVAIFLYILKTSPTQTENINQPPTSN